jgi:hypothetical protein
MDIDWTQIRSTIKRIEEQLSKAQKVIDTTEADLVRGWPEVGRAELEAAFPDWRREFGPNWRRDFLEGKIGKGNFVLRPGGRKYRISPAVYRALNLGAPKPAAGEKGPGPQDQSEG